MVIWLLWLLLCVVVVTTAVILCTIVTYGRDVQPDLTVGDFHPGLVLCRKCPLWLSISDHAGNGENRCARPTGERGKAGS